MEAGGSYRLRYESLDQPFRRGATGSDQIVVERLLVNVAAGVGPLYAAAELEDSRAFLDDSGTPLGTDDVNALEPLQAYLGGRWQGLLADGDTLGVRVGRFTMDVGSRRLVARNRFRNTLNAFTGLDADWQSAGGDRLRAFVVMPVHRRPILPGRLADNDAKLDDESRHDVLWGLFAATALGPVDAELYVIASHRRAVDVYTPGLRLIRPSARGSWDFELELAPQLGRSRNITAGRGMLDQRSGFVHLEIGRTLDAAWEPRVAAQLDWASGDDDPYDHEDNRFDTLFGARRFELGPTGIYGALARSNLLSPGLRLELAPSARLRARVGYRLALLASRRDFLTAALLRDETGASGRFVGQQLEVGLRYAALQDHLELESGGAYLIHERFLEEAPGAPAEGNTLYGYLQATYSL